MSTTVKTPAELGKAVKNGEDKIVIKGDLAGAVIKIEATGKTSYIMAVGMIAVAITGILAARQVSDEGLVDEGLPDDAIVSSLIAPPLVLALGGKEVAKAAISIAVAGGGVGILHSLRKYDVKQKGRKVYLTRR